MSSPSSSAPSPPTTVQTETPAPLPTEDSFKQALEQWVRIDDHITHHTQQLKELRQTRTSLTPALCNYMERTDNRALSIHLPNGSLAYGVEKVQPSYSQSFYVEGLAAYFREVHGDAQADERAKECMAFIKARAPTKSRATIRRKFKDVGTA